MDRADSRPIAVLGATGYIGARLVPRLLAAGWRVRAIGRNPAKLAGRGRVIPRSRSRLAMSLSRRPFRLKLPATPSLAPLSLTDPFLAIK
jgi:nucleoside-diphosphate-sugar epimerase